MSSGLARRLGQAFVVTTVVLMSSASAVLAKDPDLPAGTASSPDAVPSVEYLRGLSVEDLAQLKVTSVSKRPVALNQSPAAVFVITDEDIRRSGATSLPEALRLAPNLEVARLNAYTWSVTARGFNSPESANKLLVLIDGRSVYEPIGSGVLWQQVAVTLNNIDRIEVISGPAGAIWGANAVNGVINVIMKTGQNTRGPALNVGGGGFERTAAFSAGGRLGEQASFRVFANGFDYDRTQAAQSSDTSNDAFRGAQGGVRLDGELGHDTYTAKATYYHNEIADGGGSFRGGNLDLRWTHPFTNGSIADLHGYYAKDDRHDPSLFEGRETFDIQAQHAFSLGAGQVVWGGEYRLWRENFLSFNAFHFANPKADISLGSAFAQDEIALRPGLRLTLGLKLEQNSYSGFDWLPNLRLDWQQSPDSMMWAAVSRAVRTPNRIERELEFTGFLAPSPDFQAEKLVAFEGGWRGQPSPSTSLSVSTFYNLYDDLRTDEFSPTPTLLPIVLRNGAKGDAWGIEAWAKYQVSARWRLSAGANYLHKNIWLKAGHTDLAQLQVGGQDPHYQAQLRSEFTISPTLELDGGLRAVGHVTTSPVPGYVEADLRLGWRPTKSLELSLEGQNILHSRHLEAWDPSTLPPRYIPRTVFARLRTTF